MKKIFTLSFIALSLFSCSNSNQVEVGNKTTMLVDLVYDAGKVVKGEVIDATFEVKNTGKFPLVIGEVSGSCSCTVADKPEEPIAPGETGEIKAHVTTENASPGVISKSVRIVANTEPSITNTVIKATIIGK